MSKNILELYIDLIENLFKPRPYKNLAAFYEEKGMLEESEAFLSVIEKSNADTDDNVQQ